MGNKELDILYDIYNYTEWKMPLQASFDILQSALEDLKEFKDLEQELGIDLITLFKALEQDYVYVKFSDGEIKICSCFANCLIFEERKFKCEDEIFYFKDYGKTWALTKEELEK